MPRRVLSGHFSPLPLGAVRAGTGSAKVLELTRRTVACEYAGGGLGRLAPASVVRPFQLQASHVAHDLPETRQPDRRSRWAQGFHER
jgi:hypothetical protein